MSGQLHAPAQGGHLVTYGSGPRRKGIVRRDVTRVLTPGTVVRRVSRPGTTQLSRHSLDSGPDAGLAACDCTTARCCCPLPRAERLASELDRLAPAELLTRLPSMSTASTRCEAATSA